MFNKIFVLNKFPFLQTKFKNCKNFDRQNYFLFKLINISSVWGKINIPSLYLNLNIKSSLKRALSNKYKIYRFTIDEDVAEDVELLFYVYKKI